MNFRQKVTALYKSLIKRDCDMHDANRLRILLQDIITFTNWTPSLLDGLFTSMKWKDFNLHITYLFTLSRHCEWSETVRSPSDLRVPIQDGVESESPPKPC